MKPSLKNTLFILVPLLVCSSVLRAQSPFESKYSVGINAGTFIYQGDLTPSDLGSFKTPGWAVGIYGSRRLNPKLSARLELSFGQLKGDDTKYDEPDWRQERALKFKTPVTELAGLLVWDAWGTNRKFSPYLFAGIGYVFLDIERDYSNFNYDYFADQGLGEELQRDIEHELPRSQFIIPIGIGVRYKLTDKVGLHAEGAYRHISTDYLDGFSHAGNPQRDDAYFKYSVGVSYKLGTKDALDCPKVGF
jgi:opacity protein-like surface antigen